MLDQFAQRLFLNLPATERKKKRKNYISGKLRIACWVLLRFLLHCYGIYLYKSDHLNFI